MIRRNTFLITSLLCYLSVLVPPGFISIFVLAGYLIPVVIAVNVLIFLIRLILSREKIARSLIALIAATPFLISTFQWSIPDGSNADEFEIMSFNAKLFRRPGSYREFSMEMIEWTERDSAEIKVIPEHSTDSRWAPLDVDSRIAKYGYNAFSVSAPIEYNEHNLGSAIFSKFPVAGRGVVFNDSTSISMGIYQDVIILGDTIRVYSVHLASMGLETVRRGSIFQTFGDVMLRLMHGAVKRSDQIDKVVEHFERSPYPFILCGDFNETPYSYNYTRLRLKLKDAFIDEGAGFGLTFNTGTSLARIDYHFVSKGISVRNFRVDENMRISDHYPVRGVYRIDK
jgi:endonuclease/exonuclease/phosphatase family metal-dependent hydrolase